jgi:hypothetical protein
MSYAAQITAAATTAQTALAAACDAAGTGTFTLAGTTYTGVFNEQEASDPLDPTGTRRVRYLFILATRAQFSSAPSAGTRPALTAAGRTWSLVGVTPMPQHYRLVCRVV